MAGSLGLTLAQRVHSAGLPQVGSRDFSEGAAYGGAAFCRWTDAPHRRR